MPEQTEAYQPSEEEVQKAENMLDYGELNASEDRERMITRPVDSIDVKELARDEDYQGLVEGLQKYLAMAQNNEFEFKDIKNNGHLIEFRRMQGTSQTEDAFRAFLQDIEKNGIQQMMVRMDENRSYVEVGEPDYHGEPTPLYVPCLEIYSKNQSLGLNNHLTGKISQRRGISP